MSIDLDFKASNGWLESFIKRHNLQCSAVSGERADVDSSVVDDFKKKLAVLCDGYDAKDIFNNVCYRFQFLNHVTINYLIF